jgi:hypothetical protein
MVVFGFFSQWSIMVVCRHFRGTYCLHLLSSLSQMAIRFSSRRCRKTKVLHSATIKDHHLYYRHSNVKFFEIVNYVRNVWACFRLQVIVIVIIDLLFHFKVNIVDSDRTQDLMNIKEIG